MCNPELPERNDPKDPRPVGALEVTNAVEHAGPGQGA
jgi:hypothetical protein